MKSKNDIVATPGQRLKELMRKMNIKQIDISEIAGISKSCVSRYVRDDFQPKQDKILLISDYFGIDPLWLMGFDVPMIPIGNTKQEDIAIENELLVQKYSQLETRNKRLIVNQIDLLLEMQRRSE